MSERSYAPRSGGRATEQRSTTEPRRRTGAAGATGARGARPADDVRANRTAGADRTRVTEPGERRRGPADGARRRPVPGRGATAPVTQGTAALKLDTAVAEPVRATETAAAPRLRVAPPAPISAPRAPFIAAVIALVIAGVLGILLINTKTNENSFEISRLQEQQAALDTQQQQLENQLATYDSAGNLAAAAKRLGLVRAEAPAYIRLPDGKVIGVPRPGTGEPAVTAEDAGDTAGATGSAPVAPQGGVQAGTTQGGVQAGTTQGGVQAGTTQGGFQGGTDQGGTTQQGQQVVPGSGE